MSNRSRFFIAATLACLVVACSSADSSEPTSQSADEALSTTLAFQRKGTCDGECASRCHERGYWHGERTLCVEAETGRKAIPPLNPSAYYHIECHCWN